MEMSKTKSRPKHSETIVRPYKVDSRFLVPVIIYKIITVFFIYVCRIVIIFNLVCEINSCCAYNCKNRKIIISGQFLDDIN